MNHAWVRAGWALVIVLLGLLPHGVERMATPEAATLLTHASFGRTPDDDNAQRVGLPHRWASDAGAPCGQCRTVWYGFDIDRSDPPREDQALLLPRVGRNAALYLNGRLLVQGGRFADPAARLGSRPLWAVVSPVQWNAGANRLFVLVKSDRPVDGLMPRPALGAESDLRVAHRVREAWTVTLPQVAATAAVLMTALMGLIWRHRRQEPQFAAMAVAAALFAMWTFSGLVVEPPWSDRAWDAALASQGWLMAGSLCALAWRMVPPARAWPAGAVAAGLLVSGALAWGAQWLALGDAAQGLLHQGPSVLLLLAGVRLAHGGWRQRDGRLLVPGVALLLAVLHDAWRVAASPIALAMLPAALALVLGVLAWMLVLRFVQTLNAVELLKIDLEALVAERTHELQIQFARVRELERQQAIAGERERLMRDMHDGVGGHLVSMLAMIEADRRRPGELAVVVRDALDDMRLMIDSLEPVDDDLNAVLAMFHDRLAPRLRAARVDLHWDIELLPRVAGLTPARVLHVLRILQEGVTNAIRHGGARTLWFAARQDAVAGQVRITLRDDGGGFDPAKVVGGRGLKNMQRRAQEVGATLRVVSEVAAGSVIELDLPRDAVDAA